MADGTLLLGVLLQDGNTALHSAAYGGHLEAIELLVSKNADVQSKDNVSLSSPCVPWFASRSLCVVCGSRMRPCDVRGELRGVNICHSGHRGGLPARERERRRIQRHFGLKSSIWRGRLGGVGPGCCWVVPVGADGHRRFA